MSLGTQILYYVIYGWPLTCISKAPPLLFLHSVNSSLGTNPAIASLNCSFCLTSSTVWCCDQNIEVKQAICKYCQRLNGTKTLNTLTQSLPLDRSDQKLQRALNYMCQTSAWFCLAKGGHGTTLTNPCNKVEKSMY